MSASDSLRSSDAAVVARYLHLRTLLHDRFLARIERLILDRFIVEPTRRLPATLLAHLRGGFIRPGEGELWPVIFMTTVDITPALAVQLTAERMAGLGTTVNGPQKLRHRGWEDWYGWETALTALDPAFFDLDPPAQEKAVLGWYGACLDWLAGNGLLRRL